MYSEGSCPDYRWTYDACSPTASQLVAELISAAKPKKADKDLTATSPAGDLLRPPACLVRALSESTHDSYTVQGRGEGQVAAKRSDVISAHCKSLI